MPSASIHRSGPMDAHPDRRTARHTALVLMLWAVLDASAWPAQVDVLSSRNDDDRSGANLREGLLRPDNVRPGQFGRLFRYALPGGDVYAQPLVVTSVGVPGRGTLDLLIVATTDNHVVAFDANGPVPGGTGVVWQQFLGEAPTMDDVWTRGCRLASPCLPAPGGNIRGRVGIVSTPAVDRQRGIIYVVNRILMPAGAIAYQLHALDLHTGADRPGSPTEIAANPGPAFVAGFQNQRPGLALARGQVVIGWGAHEDFLPYHGWLMSYRYLDEGRLEQSAVFNSTPDGDESSTCALPGPAVTTLIATLNALAVAESILGAALLLTGDFVDAVLHFAAAATAKLAAEAAAVAAIPIAANQCAHGGLWMAGRAPAIDGDGNVLVFNCNKDS